MYRVTEAQRLNPNLQRNGPNTTNPYILVFPFLSPIFRTSFIIHIHNHFPIMIPFLNGAGHICSALESSTP